MLLSVTFKVTKLVKIFCLRLQSSYFIHHDPLVLGSQIPPVWSSEMNHFSFQTTNISKIPHSNVLKNGFQLFNGQVKKIKVDCFVLEQTVVVAVIKDNIC